MRRGNKNEEEIPESDCQFYPRGEERGQRKRRQDTSVRLLIFTLKEKGDENEEKILVSDCPFCPKRQEGMRMKRKS